VTRDSRCPEYGTDTRNLVYNNPNLGECYFEHVCVESPDQHVETPDYLDDSHAHDPTETPLSQTREPAQKQDHSKPATERATTKPAHKGAVTKPAREGGTPQPAHEWASDEHALKSVIQPADEHPVPLSSAQASQHLSGLDNELDDLVSNLAAQYKEAISWTMFVENFRGNEGDFHPEVKSITHAVAPLLD
jgi:hypothetical protein